MKYDGIINAMYMDHVCSFKKELLRWFEELYPLVENAHKEGLDVYFDGIKIYRTEFDGKKGLSAPIPLYKKMLNEFDGEIIKENNVPLKIKLITQKHLTYTVDCINIEYRYRVIIFDIRWNKNKDDKKLPNIIITDIPIKPERLQKFIVQKAKKQIIQIENRIGLVYNLDLCE